MAKEQNPIQKAIKLFSRLPGIGPKSAARIVFALLKTPEHYIKEFAETLTALKTEIKECSICSNLSSADPCEICTDPKRNRELLCVVEGVSDLIAIERTGEYRGLYHILGGVISPIDDITPDKLNISKLIKRLKQPDCKVKEVIIATNATVEGETTAIYLREQLQGFELKISRIASGIPMGGDIEYIDRATLSYAIQQRRTID